MCRNPAPGAQASKGSFTVDCGTNGNGKFSPDNPVAQPGIKNGAEHVHDFVGNLAITANSSNADLDASGTTCKNGDKSSYFWPVVRIDKNVRSKAETQRALAATTPMVTCPSVRDRLPAVPANAKDAVDTRLAALDRAYDAANRGWRPARAASTPTSTNPSWRRYARNARSRSRASATPSPRPAGAAREWSRSWNATPTTTACTPPCATPRPACKAGLVATPQIQCPTVRDKLPGVPAQALNEVNRNLAELDRQISEANERLVTTRGQGGKNFVDNAILGPLKAKRTAVLDRIGIAISRTAARPQGLEDLTGCTVTGQAQNNQNGQNNQNNGQGNQNGQNGGAAAPSKPRRTA